MAHILNIANLKYSIYATFTISSLIEFPADVAAIAGLDLLGRRWSAFCSLFLSGLFMLASAFSLGKIELIVETVAEFKFQILI